MVVTLTAQVAVLVGFGESTGTWTNVDAGAGAISTPGDYNNLAEYSPSKQVAIFGGGGSTGDVRMHETSGKYSDRNYNADYRCAYPVDFGATDHAKPLPILLPAISFLSLATAMLALDNERRNYGNSILTGAGTWTHAG